MSLAARFGCFGEEKEENGEKYFIYQKVSCAPTGKDVHVGHSVSSVNPRAA